MTSLRGRVTVLVVVLVVAVLIGGRAVSEATTVLSDARGFAREQVLPLMDRMAALRSALAAEAAMSRASLSDTGTVTALLDEQRGTTDAALSATASALAAGDADQWTLVSSDLANIESSFDDVDAAVERLRADVDSAPSDGDPASLAPDVSAVEGARAQLDGDITAAWAQALAVTDEAVANLRRAQAVTFGLLLLVIVGIAVFLRSWVVAPVRRLAASMDRTATGYADDQLDAPLDVNGPREIRSMGRSADDMRRRLVDELRESRRATEALRDESPTVDAVRRVLYESAPAPVAGYDVVGSVTPAHGVLAGDWWDLIACPNGSTALVTVDVAGHGVSAGVSALRLRDCLTVLLREGWPAGETIARACSLLGEAQLATAIVVMLHPDCRTITYVNAGHPPAWIVDANGVHELSPSGPLLCELSSDWKEEQVEFAAGSLLVCFTDGAVEARRKGGLPLGEEGLLAAVQHAFDIADGVPGATDVHDAARAAALDSAGPEPSDDITLVVVGHDADRRP
jgi:serine phosphatase RsbU (regulator of sigma subunit)